MGRWANGQILIYQNKKTKEKEENGRKKNDNKYPIHAMNEEWQQVFQMND